ncbi:MAG TPA: hypothetical protein VGN48_17735 [Pedococcus sp.]|jgi:hypothetical protein|nr:hypothetical protein [Pedococcus sp.]
MSSRRIAFAAALAVAGLGLVGAGAGAQFTDAVAVQQHITAGTIDVQLTSSDPSVTLSHDGKTATFADLGPTQSTFSSGAIPTVITNHGTATASAIVLSADDLVGSGANSAALASQLCVKIVSSGQTAYDGVLSGLKAHPLQIQGDVPTGGTDSFTTEFYAGSGACPSLTNAAQGGDVQPSVTVNYVG